MSDSKVIGKPTPGPWTVREVRGQHAFAIDFNEDQEQVVEWVYEEADAHLISAAPDLLEAMEQLFEIGQIFASAIEKNHPSADFESWSEKAKSAIAKAKGLAQ